MSNDQIETPRGRDLDRRVSSATARLLMVWVGIALLTDVGWGGGLIGAGVLLLAEQAVRWRSAVQFEWFWVGAGIMACLSGVGMLFGVQVSLVPILMIVVGITLIGSTLQRSHESS